jgi:hypothetical protein
VNDGIVIKLIIPNQVVEGILIDFLERCPDRVIRGIAEAGITLLQSSGLAARKYKLLTEVSVILDGAAKWAAPDSGAAAAREGRRIELKNNPPIYRVIFGNKRERCAGCSRG